MVRKIKLAASLLASFKFENVGFLSVVVYYKGGGVGYIGTGPDSLEDDDGRSWSKKQWREYLTKKIGSGLSVKAIYIAFTDKDEEAEDRIGCVMYRIEASDLDANPRFDRILVFHGEHKCDKYEVMLTPNEQSKIHGTSDVKRLYRKLLDKHSRQVEVKTDLAKILPTPTPDKMPLPDWPDNI